MDGSYERRLFGSSPLVSPIKSTHSTPNKTPVKAIFHDRFIPVRNTSLWKEDKQEYYQTLEIDNAQNVPPAHLNGNNCDNENKNSGNLLSDLINSELLSDTNNSHNYDAEYDPDGALENRRNHNTFSYKQIMESPNKLLFNNNSEVPFSENTKRILKSPRPQSRKIPKLPYKVLDAPDLQDDFYLNLVDWSYQNVLAVGLGTCVYLWNAVSSEIIRLCDVNSDNDSITSVSWSEKGNHVAVGTHHGIVQIWDVAAETQLLTLDGHTARVGTLAWNAELLASGSRDRNVHLRDTRCPRTDTRPLKEHRQEVCGLKWSLDKQHLASGGNDNRLVVWSLTGQSGGGSAHLGSRATAGASNSGAGGSDQPASAATAVPSSSGVSATTTGPGTTAATASTSSSNSSSHSLSPLIVYENHAAAVKAIAWSPHQHGLLASGGGTADRCIKFWNILTRQAVHSVDTGSQVCNVAWSPHTNELVSTHGYSQNQIVVWKYPGCVPLAKLTGHSCRVLYLALSPDGSNVVTGAGDETLRFWNVFEKPRTTKTARPNRSSLDLFGGMR